MNVIQVRRSDYGWSSYPAYYIYGCDQYRYYDIMYFTAGGCQNPGGLPTVYVNCHIGNS